MVTSADSGVASAAGPHQVTADVPGSADTSVLPVVRPPARRRALAERYPSWLVGVAVFVAYTCFSVAIFHVTWRAPGTRVIGSCCDQPSTINLLRWTGFAVTHGHNPFVMHFLHAPQGINLMWQPNGMPLLGLVATPLEWLFGPIVTYNALITLALSVSGLTCYVALRRWVGGYAGPMVGGLLYGFSPFMTTHALGHLNIMFAPIPPLLLLALSDLVAYRRWPWWVSGSAVGVLGAAQLMLGQEVLVGTVIASGLMVAVLAICHPAEAIRRWRRVVAGLACALAAMSVLVAWPLYELIAGPYRLQGRFEPTPFSTDLLNLVLPNVTGQFKPDGGGYFFAWHWSLGESDGLIGVVLIALAIIVSAKRWNRSAVKVAAVGGGVMLMLSLGPSVVAAGLDLHVWLPARLLLKLPLLENMLPTRLFVFVDLAVAFLLAEFVRWSLRASRASTTAMWRRICLVGAGAVVLLGIVPLAPSIHYLAITYPSPAFFTTSAVKAIPTGGNTLVVPYPEGGPADGAPMIWQAQADFHFAMVGGYVYVPGSNKHEGARYGGRQTGLTTALAAIVAGQPAPALTSVVLNAMRADLASLDLKAVVVGPMIGEDNAIRLLTTLIGRRPVQTAGVALWVGRIA